MTADQRLHDHTGYGWSGHEIHWQRDETENAQIRTVILCEERTVT